jgi:hypothetical protein
MYEFKLRKIRCYDIEDNIGHDELTLNVYADGVKQETLEGKLKVGETWNIDKYYCFENILQLKLVERDPGPDDFLGQIIVSGETVTGSNRHFEPSPFSSYKLTYDVKESDGNEVDAQHRVLLVASELSQTESFAPLYEWLEENAIFLPENMVDTAYRSIVTLTGAAMTPNNFVDKLNALALNSANRAVDVILAVHGHHENLVFHGQQAISASALCNQIAESIPGDSERKRLRMLYSAACYGKDHADDFVSKAGFRVASGAKGVNANSAIEYPAFLLRWRMGQSFQDSLAINPILNEAQDRLAKMLNEAWVVNSTKAIFGDEDITIKSPAD